LGLRQAGFRLAGAVDADPTVLTVYRTNFPAVPLLGRDLFSAAGGQVREGLRIGKKVIDLLAGGPPCQGFSSGGIKKGNDPRNQGVLAFARLVAELKPRYFLMENVRGFLFSEHEPVRVRFCQTLKKAGYAVRPFCTLNAADFGVPQRRFRVFVLGCLRSEAEPDYPVPDPGLQPTVRDAIGDLAALDKLSKAVDSDVYDGPLGEASSYAAAMRAGPSGAGCEEITGCLRTRHSEMVVGRFMATPPGGQEPVSRFFRLTWDGVSPTLRAGTGPDHGSHTAPRPIHPEWPRCITVREAARLHSFPDRFVFHGTRWHGFREIGNSVPPLLAQAVAAQVHSALSGRR